MAGAHTADGPLATFLVERYWPGVTADAVRATEERLEEEVVRLKNEGIPIRYLSSTLIPSEESVFSVFQGRSADEVAEVNRRSEVPFDRILLATEIRPSVNPKSQSYEDNDP